MASEIRRERIMNGSHKSLYKMACGKKAREGMQKAGAGRSLAVSTCAAEVPGRMVAFHSTGFSMLSAWWR